MLVLSLLSLPRFLEFLLAAKQRCEDSLSFGELLLEGARLDILEPAMQVILEIQWNVPLFSCHLDDFWFFTVLLCLLSLFDLLIAIDALWVVRVGSWVDFEAWLRFIRFLLLIILCLLTDVYRYLEREHGQVLLRLFELDVTIQG